MKELPRNELGRRVFVVDSFDEPGHVAREHLITSVQVEEGPSHDIVHVWNRGGKSGTLAVNKGDGFWVAERLLTTNGIEVRGGDMSFTIQ